MSGPVCPNCGQQNRVGELLCAYCGVGQLGDRLATRQLETPAGDGHQPIGSARFGPGSKLRVFIGEDTTPREFAIDESITIGRADPASPSVPDINLTQYLDSENSQGVSRWHARIERGNQSLQIVDTGSTNGTWVNGTLLARNNYYPLRDTDVICFGKIKVRIYFS